MNADDPQITSPDKRVQAAIDILARFDVEMKQLETERKQLVEQAIAQGEGRVIDRIREWITRIFSRLISKT